MVRALALRTALPVAGVLVLLALWWAVAASRLWPPVFVPSPGAVWHQLIATSTVHDGQRGYAGHLLHEHLAASLRRILLGSLYGITGGVALGLLIGLVPTVRALLSPLVTFVRTLPPLAYFSLLIIWFGIDELPKTTLLLIAALPPVAVATAEAVRGVHADYLNAARSLGARGWQIPLRIVLPSALPEVMTGVRVAVGVAYTTVVAAETVNGVPGIGGMIRDAQRYNQTDLVVLGLLVIGVSGLLIDAALQLAERRLAPWRGRT
ncbi:ABC transporter permease [Actinomadura kijaniata]|uniref:ABC transporter permease n=1 Tax=Actinomadura kijaniata TaxID=46161 RepID=UPI001FE03385|nr:ABC transporter permease [Actinomadura kijaniata]